eukprot:TRINITY_DN6241_c0_g1_i9.p1 TRINITY_DN6241_c0_g1~~TRINITY_DN6241_c0_g1_i9.p1  ORF type:complete len:164 (-),score=34.32 TRINITY_DN6241_c0_g1_i9:61-552(-)
MCIRDSINAEYGGSHTRHMKLHLLLMAACLLLVDASRRRGYSGGSRRRSTSSGSNSGSSGGSCSTTCGIILACIFGGLLLIVVFGLLWCHRDKLKKCCCRSKSTNNADPACPGTSFENSTSHRQTNKPISFDPAGTCLLYTSDAADEEDSVDLGGRRIIKKKR